MFFKNNTLQKLMLGLTLLGCVQNDCAAQPEEVVEATHDWGCTEIPLAPGKFILGEALAPDHPFFAIDFVQNATDIIKLFQALMGNIGLFPDYPLTMFDVGVYAHGIFRNWHFTSESDGVEVNMSRSHRVAVPVSQDEIYIQLTSDRMVRFKHPLADGRFAIGLMLTPGDRIHPDSILPSPIMISHDR